MTPLPQTASFRCPNPYLSPLARGLCSADAELLAPLRIAALPPDEPLTGPPRSRAEIAEALVAANRAYGHPRAAELGARLGDPGTRVVVTGQQPGLFGGPLYTLTKIIAAVKVAAVLEARGEAAVPLFWIATEDHDWREVARAHLGPKPREITLGEDPSPLLPLGLRRFDATVEEELKGLIGGAEPVYAEGLRKLGRWYRAGTSYGDAFAGLMVDLLGSRAPLFVDALHPKLKEHERPWLRLLIERREAVDAALIGAEERIESRGYGAQVHHTSGQSPVFLLDGHRRCRIEWEGSDSYRLRGVRSPPAPVGELLRRLESSPGDFSPGVLARPLIQDAVLGTSLQILGPAELSYMAQAAALYPVLEVPPPAVALRPHALLLTARQGEQLSKVIAEGVELPRILDDASSLDRHLAARVGCDFVRPAAEELKKVLDGIGRRALELDPDLERPWHKTGDQVARSLELFATKVDAAAARRNQVLRQRIDNLRSALLPGGRLQERVLSVAHFAALLGTGLAERIYEGLEVGSSELQLLILEGGDG